MSTPPLERRADGFLHHHVDTGEVRLHVAQARPAGVADDAEVPAEIPLVVMLHGFPEFYWTWRHQLGALSAAGLWAVAPDLRGYNESDKPKGVSAYEVEKMAADIAGLIRALGRKKAIIVAHDWGGIVAWSFAQEHPEMLERLAVLNIPHPLVMANGLRRPAQMKKSWYVFFFQLPFLPERAVLKDDFAFVRRTFRADKLPAEDIERFIDALRAPGAVRSAINYYRAGFRRVLLGRLPKLRTIEQPVLVIWGDKDRYLGSEMATPPKRFVSNARVVHLPSSSHWVQNDAPDKVSELLVDFIREQS
jgi:pimeloyl-ACP methyl ester carboxylesterase